MHLGMTENGIGIGRFQELKLKPLNNGTYTEREKEIIKSIREKFTINKNTLLRKYIKPEQVEKYISGDYTSVQGCISRAEDYSDVGDFEDIYYSFRLDYAPPKGGVPDYSPTQTSYWKIEFRTMNKELKKIDLRNTYGYEFGGNNTLPDPCTQNAFTGSENGKVLPEWNLEKEMIDDKCIQDEWGGYIRPVTPGEIEDIHYVTPYAIYKGYKVALRGNRIAEKMAIGPTDIDNTDSHEVIKALGIPEVDRGDYTMFVPAKDLDFYERVKYYDKYGYFNGTGKPYKVEDYHVIIKDGELHRYKVE